MLFGLKKYRFSYLASITAFITVFNVLFGPLFFGFENNFIQKARAAAITWVGGATGTWETAANWSGSAVPTASDDVTISSTTGHIVVTLSSGQTANFSSLTIGGDGTYIATTTFIGNIGTAGSMTINSKGNIVQQNTTQQIFTGTITVASGGILTHTANTTSQLYEVDISAANINVQAGGSINVNSKGYTGGSGGADAGDGTGGGVGDGGGGGAGGSHGGNGGNSVNYSGLGAYCDISSPVTIGSGGGVGGNGNGGSGGGVIILNASATFTINGTIATNGGAGTASYGAGGAGGAIKITADTIAGTPESFSITGGAGQTYSGGGGGGCSLLSYTATNSIVPSSHISMGGGAGSNQRGGAGVVYIKKVGTNGDLYSTNSGSNGAGSDQTTTSLVADSFTIMTSSTYIIASGKTLDLRNGSPFSSGDKTGILQVANGGIFTPTTSVDFTVASTTLEVYRGSTITASTSVNMILDYDGKLLQTGFVSTSSPLPFSSLYVKNGGVLTHTANTTTQKHIINLSVVSSTLAIGGVINATGRGYVGVVGGAGVGNGPGAGGAPAGGGGGGGGHSGAGGAGYGGAAAGSAYCVSSTPGTIGSSGGAPDSSGPSGQGGGLIILSVTNNFAFNGSVIANGALGSGGNSPGGAGGGIYITAGTVLGSLVSLSANGAAGGGSYGGSGGGGCIAVSYRVSNSATTSTVAGGVGGQTNGVAGTFVTSQINASPNAPITHYSSATTAQSESTNPTLLSTTTPSFSAIFSDNDTSDTTVLAQIQVSTSSDFSWISHWNSGSATIASCNQGSRCQDMKFGNFGTAPSTTLTLGDDTNENSQTTYYWRLRYFDAANATGVYSTTTNTFTLLDKPNAPTSLSGGTITASAATLTWTDNSNLDTSFSLESSEDGGVTFAVATTTAASASSITTSTLSANTRYIYRVAATNSVGTSSYATSSAFYTLANSAGTPSATVVSATVISLTLDANNNSTSTTYSILSSKSDEGDGVHRYLAADGSLGDAAVFQTTSTWSGVNANGLTPNSGYQFTIGTRNGSGIDAASSSVSTAVYTLANIPTSVAVQTTGLNGQLQVTWNANSNPAGTEFYVEETNDSSINSGWITGTTKTFTGLTAGQTYSFHVRARNTDSIATAYTSSVSGTVPTTGGGAGATGSNNPVVPPPPTPFNPPTEEPIDEFAPTGLIKIISPTAGDFDVLSQAGLSSPYTVNSINKAVGVNSADNAINLQAPFTLKFSFALDNHPLDANVNTQRQVFAKNTAYSFGFFPDNDQITIQKGMCFYVNNFSTSVCDDIFGRQAFTAKKQYNYRVVWNGNTLDLFDGNAKLDSKTISAISANADPLVVGGRKYVSGLNALTSFYPSTIYEMRINSEPLLMYTNKSQIKLKIDSSYAPEFALKESSDAPSDDFSGSAFQSIASEMNWNLTGADGKKCVNARFKSQIKNFKYDTYACVILDTKKPSSDFTFDSGKNNNGVFVVSPRIYGISDPNALLTITKMTALGPAVGDTNPPAVSGIWIAGDATTVINVKANKDGTWSHTFSEQLTKGTYVFSVSALDLAGNTSDPVSKNVDVEEGVLAPIIPIIPEDPIPKEIKPEVGTPDEDVKKEDEPLKPEEVQPEEIKPDDVIPEETVPKDEPVTEEIIVPKQVAEIKPDDQNAEVDGEKETQPENNPSTVEKIGQAFLNAIGKFTGSDKKQDGNVGKENFDGNVLKINEPSSFGGLAGELARALGIDKLRAFIARESVQKANTRVAVPAAAIVGLANIMTGFHLPQLFNLLRYLFGQPVMLARRRKQKTWGVVYNSFSKLPVDLATLRLIDEDSGRVLSSQVTDFYGRYFVSANIGHYRLELIKPGFVGFSEHLKEKNEDTKFINLYHGEAFYSPHEDFEINYNIPLDPETENKPTTKILRDNLIQKIQYGISFAGLGASIISFVVTPIISTGILIFFHISFLIIFYVLGNKKLPPTLGIIRSGADKSPVAKAVVRVFDSAYNKLVNTAVTDRHGRYAVLVGPSVYYVTYEKAGFAKKQTAPFDYSSKKTKGMGGIINRDEILEPE